MKVSPRHKELIFELSHIQRKNERQSYTELYKIADRLLDQYSFSFLLHELADIPDRSGLEDIDEILKASYPESYYGEKGEIKNLKIKEFINKILTRQPI